jgi:phage/plasmid-associated DNA primase
MGSAGTQVLTGGDLIAVERKFQRSFSFVNGTKLAFSIYGIPDVKDDANSHFFRWVVMTFPNVFDEAKAGH